MPELIGFKSVSMIGKFEHFLDLIRFSFDMHPIGSAVPNG